MFHFAFYYIFQCVICNNQYVLFLNASGTWRGAFVLKMLKHYDNYNYEIILIIMLQSREISQSNCIELSYKYIYIFKSIQIYNRLKIQSHIETLWKHFLSRNTVSGSFYLARQRVAYFRSRSHDHFSIVSAKRRGAPSRKHVHHIKCLALYISSVFKRNTYRKVLTDKPFPFLFY